jgi:hypothetical protein
MFKLWPKMRNKQMSVPALDLVSAEILENIRGMLA